MMASADEHGRPDYEHLLDFVTDLATLYRHGEPNGTGQHYDMPPGAAFDTLNGLIDHARAILGADPDARNTWIAELRAAR
jgi:hypothetical protein